MSFTRQQAPHGLGHAVWCARDIVGDEPFAVMLPDELVLNNPGCLKQMIEAADEARRQGQSVIAVEEVPADKTHQYGICGVGKRDGKMFEIDGMIEKPTPRAPRRRTCRSPAATSCSRRSSRSWRPRSAAPAARSSSPTR